MDIFFTDPNEIPLPPQEVRIRALKAAPWEDGQRVKVMFEIDPFQKRPNVDLRVEDANGREVAAVTVIESMDRKMEFTLHLRGGLQQGAFKLSAVVFYTEPLQEGEEPRQPEPTVVDRAETTFDIPGA